MYRMLAVINDQGVWNGFRLLDLTTHEVRDIDISMTYTLISEDKVVNAFLTSENTIECTECNLSLLPITTPQNFCLANDQITLLGNHTSTTYKVTDFRGKVVVLTEKQVKDYIKKCGCTNATCKDGILFTWIAKNRPSY